MVRLAAAALASLFANGAASSFDTVALMQLQGPPNTRTEPKNRPEEKKWYIKSAGAVHPEAGETMVGDLLCDNMNMGVRLTVKKWPSDIRVYVYPQPTLDMSTDRWCPGIHTCSAGFDAKAVVDEDVLNITYKKGGNNNMTNCGWSDFSMIGSFWEGENGMNGKGSLYTPTGPNEEPHLHAHYSDNYQERFSVHCRQLYNNILGRIGGGGVLCHKFEMHKCVGRPAGRGEKVIYFMRAFAGDGPGESDPPLKSRDRKLALSQKNNPMFRKAFGDEPDRRADIIYVAPTTRAIESAAISFGTERVPIVVDARLKDWTNKLFKDNALAQIRNLTDYGFIYPEIASKVLDGYEKMNQKRKDKDLDRDILGGSNERIEHFFDDLLKRPEKRIVVVGHNNLMNHAFGTIDFPGGVEVRLLQTNRVVSSWSHDPNCFGSV